MAGSSATGNRFGFINNSTLVPVSFLRLIVTLFLRHISHDLRFYILSLSCCSWCYSSSEYVAYETQILCPQSSYLSQFCRCQNMLLIWCVNMHYVCVCVLWLWGVTLGESWRFFHVYADNSHSSVLLTQDTIEIRWTSTSFTMRACPMTQTWCTASIKGPRGRSLTKTSFFI